MYLFCLFLRRVQEHKRLAFIIIFVMNDLASDGATGNNGTLTFRLGEHGAFHTYFLLLAMGILLLGLKKHLKRIKVS